MAVLERLAKHFLPVLAGLATLVLATPAWAAERAEALLYVLVQVDIGGVAVPLIMPEPQKALTDSGMANRPSKAFEMLRARSPKAYGATSLRINSATSATIVLDKVADADQVLAETFWTLGAQGFSDLTAPPDVQGPLTVEKLSYGSAAPVLYPWDLLRFHESASSLNFAMALIGGQPMPAAEALKRLQRGDAAARKDLTLAVEGQALHPKLAILEAIADGAMRTAFKLKSDDAVPALKDRSVQVRGAALDAVIAAGFAGQKNVITALETLVENDTDIELKLRAVKAMSKNGVTKYADLLESEKLKTGTAQEALSAVHKLSKSTQIKIAAPALVGALSHSDAVVRDAAFAGLVELKQFDLLFTAMDGDQLSAKMREQIAKTLVENGSPAAQDASLVYLITKGSADGAILAAETYGKRGNKMASPQLIDALKHDSAEVRGTAAQALAALKEERAIVPLADAAAARPRDKEVMMKAAVEILASLRLDQVKQLADSKNTDVRQMAIRALADFAKGSRPKPDVVAILQNARKDTDLNIKRSAVYALARLQDDGIARDLAEMQKDPDAEIRLQVALSLGAASNKFEEADKLLLEMVKDTDKKVRIEAINGLTKRKAQTAVPTLMGLVHQPDPEVKRAVFAALLSLRDQGNAEKMRPLFRKGMEFKDSQVRATCVTALSDKVTLDDIEALRQAAFDPSKDVKLAAITALASTKRSEVMDPIANFFSDNDMVVREKAIDALCGIDAGESAKAKRTYLKDAIESADMPEALKAKATACQKGL
jgi:bilin biosynthesis protein